MRTEVPEPCWGCQALDAIRYDPKRETFLSEPTANVPPN